MNGVHFPLKGRVSYRQDVPSPFFQSSEEHVVSREPFVVQLLNSLVLSPCIPNLKGTL